MIIVNGHLFVKTILFVYIISFYKSQAPDFHHSSHMYIREENPYLPEYRSTCLLQIQTPVERIPGEKVYIDWIGDQPEILMDSITGELKKVHFFVTTVGVSNLITKKSIQKMVLTTGAGLPASVHIWRSLLIRYYLHHSTKSRHTTAAMASCICVKTSRN